jgi:hypothetical protein
MKTLRGWIVMSWITLPGVTIGGSLLLRHLTAAATDLHPHAQTAAEFNRLRGAATALY